MAELEGGVGMFGSGKKYYIQDALLRHLSWLRNLTEPEVKCQFINWQGIGHSRRSTWNLIVTLCSDHLTLKSKLWFKPQLIQFLENRSRLLSIVHIAWMISQLEKQIYNLDQWVWNKSKEEEWIFSTSTPTRHIRIAFLVRQPVFRVKASFPTRYWHESNQPWPPAPFS